MTDHMNIEPVGTVADAPPSNTCIYQFTHGPKQGEFCNIPAVNNQQFCPQCSKKKQVRHEYFPSNQEVSLKVTMFNKELRLYREVSHGFIIREIGLGSIYVIGKAVDYGIVPLTFEDKEICYKMGLIVTS